MGDRLKLLVTFGGSGLTGMAIATWVFGSGLAELGHRISPDLDHPHVGPTCGDASIVSEATFYAEMSRKVVLMHAGMDIAPSGNTDRDFARMMIPHHQGAIDMALLQLKYGRDERLRRLAQSIIVEQGQEIAYMRTLLDTPADPMSGTDHIAGR